MIEVEHHGGGRLGGAGEARGDQGVGKSGEVLAVDAVFKPGKGGALARAGAGARGGRSTRRCNTGSCRRRLASLPSAYPEAM